MAENIVDILIIGSGPSGAVAAWNLSRNNYSIMCLEQGKHTDSSDYPSTKRNWELLKKNKYHFSPNVRKLESDYPINDKESPISISNFNAVGGGSILFSGHFPRFHPSDFRVKTLDGIADDWPIDYSTLEPYFSRNDKMMGVSGITDDTAYPPIDWLLPPIPLGLMGETIGKGFNKLGWHWWPSYSAIITKQYKGRAKCINLGPCNTGCAQGAKSSVDITYWPYALQNGVKLKTQCRVREISVDDSDKATGVIYFDKRGVECRQKARVVIIACNGVGTPRLLLNSCSKYFPDGLANRSNMVGRNLMMHPLGYVEGVFEEHLASNLGPQGCCVQSQEFYETDTKRGFARGYTMQMLRGPGPVETALSGVALREIPWGIGHHEAFNKRFGHTIGMGIIVEDLPEPHNCVTLDKTLVDANGIPAPKISYKLGDNSKKMLAHGLTKGKEVMLAAGSSKCFAFGPVREAGWHLMGTTRMGTDPKNSVVNEWGRSHDVKNLFVVDSSIFVTSGGVNPVSTMQAISLYITDGMKNNMNSFIQ
jgi:choline dehydrogenase-like flavoprotein